jgi:uncharacterized protein
MSIGPVPEVRNLQFPVGEHIARFWHGEQKSVTQFYNNLSVFFPEGERFFIQSVKHYRDAIKDDAQLSAEARAFYAQEGIHSREHVRYNQMLRAQGYPIDAMEARITRVLAFVTRINPPRMRLAVTCALEHFTALMADLLLQNPATLEGADPVMARLWRWHAAEENEHKAVAFDVFKAVGGTYTERVITMISTTLIFWFKVIEQQARMMHADGTAWNLLEWVRLGRYLFVKPGGMLRLIPKYFSYFRPSFHPWDHDNRAELEAWKRSLEAEPDYGRVA